MPSNAQQHLNGEQNDQRRGRWEIGTRRGERQTKRDQAPNDPASNEPSANVQRQCEESVPAYNKMNSRTERDQQNIGNRRTGAARCTLTNICAGGEEPINEDNGYRIEVVYRPTAVIDQNSTAYRMKNCSVTPPTSNNNVGKTYSQ